MWILGYSSLIRDLPDVNSKGAVIPLRLNHWRRTWSAYRSDGYPFPKRYVDEETFDVVPHFTFANIVRQENGSLNGVASWIPDSILPTYDFREYGYSRVNVRPWCSRFDGQPFGEDIYAYVDCAPQTGKQNECISVRYLNMGIRGALTMDAVQPGFSDEYMRSTPLPKGGVGQWTFLFVGLDGKTLWILDEYSGRQTCILVLPVAFRGAYAPRLKPEESSEWQIPCADSLAHYDVRYRQSDSQFASAKRHPVLESLQVALNADNPLPFTHSAHWLVRLACLCRADFMDCAQSLVDDPDAWVSHLAKEIVNLPLHRHAQS